MHHQEMTTITISRPIVEEVGLLEIMETTGYPILRGEFVAIVARELDREREQYAPRQKTIDKLLETASRMPRFPFTTYMHKRGCGCVVGEYLVAIEAIGRARAANLGVTEALEEQEDSQFLRWFGGHIDTEMKDWWERRAGLVASEIPSALGLVDWVNTLFIVDEIDDEESYTVEVPADFDEHGW